MMSRGGYTPSRESSRRSSAHTTTTASGAGSSVGDRHSVERRRRRCSRGRVTRTTWVWRGCWTWPAHSWAQVRRPESRVTRVWFRNADNRYPFLWESDDQPAARWHAAGEGPTQYLADTPDGAWAEFLRHEEITDPADLRGIERALWAVEVDEDAERIAAVKDASRSHPVCQAEARALRDGGAT